jgi:hypothetical protein
MHFIRLCAAVLSVWFLASSALAYPVGPAISLDELFGKADLVIKGEVISTKPVEDASFEPVHQFRPVETRLKVLATYKGRPKAEVIAFRHYAENNDGSGYMYMPQHYKFDVGRSYIVFAATTEEAGVFKQLWKSHNLQEDQGVVLAASKEPHADESIKEVIWRELMGHLKSEKETDVFYGLTHLDEMSGGGHSEMHEFEREEVLDAVKGLLSHRDADVARVAVGILGCRNPYLSPDFAPGWLATIGSGDIPGYGLWDPTKENVGGRLYWKQLAAVVDGDAEGKTRALAVRALGRAQEPAAVPAIKRWLGDKDPLVRQAAIVLSADYPDEFDRALLKKFATDPEPLVRQGAAQAIGFGQFAEQAVVLGTLLKDADARVVRDAALSLLSLPMEASQSVLKEHLEHPQYKPLFVNALAAKETEKYVPQLSEVVRKNLMSENWWGGRTPWGVSWDLLFKHARRQPLAKLQRGEMDAVFEVLEYPIAGDPKGPSYYSSSEPRDLYALYLQCGLTERAKKFRAKCVKTITYDIDYYFKQVDERPETYRRE